MKDSVKAGQQLNVRFALGAADGTPIPDGLAQTLADACAVRVTFAGAAECAIYDPAGDAFQALPRTSHSVPPGAYEVRVSVTVDALLAASGSRTVEIR